MNRLQKAFKALTGRSSNVNLGGANNIFGSIASGSTVTNAGVDFIPVDNNGGIFEFAAGNMSPKWLGLNTKEMQFWAYRYCSPLAAVIDRCAEADTNGKLKFVDEDGIVIKNINSRPKLKRIKKLLSEPNPFQTWEEFNSQQVVLCKIFGYCPVFAVCPAGFDKSHSISLFNLNPYYAKPVLNEKYSLYDKSGSLIKSWKITIQGEDYNISSDDILLIKDGFVDAQASDSGLPISKIAGLDYFVSNICAAMEADNVLLKKKGPLGVFSYDAKPDIGGILPMKGSEKDELQQELSRYGLTLGQLQYVISKTPIKWNSMSFNLRDLMTKETVRQGIEGICDRIGYPAELMSGKNATYENRSSAEKYFYQNNVIPFSLRRAARYDKFFGLDEDGVSIIMDYDHLPVLQEDIMSAGQARKANSESVKMDWESGLITWNEARTLNDMDTVSGMDIYISEYIEKFGYFSSTAKPKSEEEDVKKDDKKDTKKQKDTKPDEDEITS
jgi:hypothetical protein